MPSLRAQIQTERPSRYLVQFCKHAAAIGGVSGHRPRMHLGRTSAGRQVQVRAEWSDSHGVVTFSPWGQCTMSADADMLTLCIEATDQDALQQIQDIISQDLARFSRREPLIVNWHPPESPGAAEGQHNDDGSADR
jgi:hypothetical protein